MIAFFITSVADNIWLLLLSSFISAFGFGPVQPAVQTLTMKSVSNDRRGAASSTNFIGMDLGSLIGPTLAGTIAESFGYAVMWRVMVIPFFISMALVVFFRGTIGRVERDFQAKV